MTTQPIIGFAGLDAMGGGMACSLVRKGFPVYGYAGSSADIDKFVAAGGQQVSTPREMAAKADVVISMVAGAEQTSSLLFEGQDSIIQELGRDKALILCSTTTPSFVLDLRTRLDQHDRKDIRLLDCPVSGGTIRAANGTLSIFASGTDEDLHHVEPVLRAMAKHVHRTGSLSNGTKTKTVHQLLAATNIISAAEALGLAATVNLNTRSIVDHVNKSPGASFMFTNRAERMLADHWHVYSALASILEDTMKVTSTAREVQFSAPMASTAESLYLRGVDAGLLHDDDAKIVQLYLPSSQGDLVAHMTRGDVLMTSSHQVSKETISEMLSGIHLAASIEAMAFCQKLGLDRKTMSEIIIDAAGSNAMFKENIPQMLEKDVWTLTACPVAKSVGEKLSEVVDKCRLIGYPCPMAATALQQFHFAALKDKVIRRQSRLDR